MARIWQGYAQFHKEFGDLDKAKQFISKALEIYEKLGVVALIVSAYTELCKINIEAGDLVAADRILAKTWLLKEVRTDFSSLDILEAEAILRIVQRKYDDAEKVLNSAMDITKKFRQPFFTFLINLYLSNVYYSQNETSKALLKLEKVVIVSRSKGYDYILARAFHDHKWMIQELRKNGFEPKYIMSVIDKYEIDAHWIDARLFGAPKVAVDEREILETSWITMKSKKLFFYLLLHKNERVNHDVLIDALWQKASHKSGSDSLRKALQHIRQMYKAVKTGKGDLVLSSKGFYQLSSKVAIRIDTEDFENLVKKIKDMGKDDSKYESFLRKAISIYKDGFAPGWYDAWVEDRRRYYQNLYEDCLLLLADYYMINKRFKDAIVFYKKLILANIFNEEYHRKIMTAYNKVGRYKDIIRDFEQLKRSLKKELDTDPQEETVKLYNELVNKN